MRQALDVEKETTLEQMEEWDKAAKSFNTNGANLFRGVYMSLLRDGKPIPSPLLPTKELLVYYRRRKKKPTHQI